MAPRTYQPTPTAQRLRALRLQEGLTQARLGERAGTSQAIVSDIERGKLRPNPELLAAFATALGVSADQLLGLEQPDQPRIDPDQQRLWKKFRKLQQLPDKDQRAVLRLLNSLTRATGS